VNRPILQTGYLVTFHFLDKGLFELLGPRGIYGILAAGSYQTQRFHTGIVYHYAGYILLVFLVLVAFHSWI